VGGGGGVWWGGGVGVSGGWGAGLGLCVWFLCFWGGFWGVWGLSLGGFGWVLLGGGWVGRGVVVFFGVVWLGGFGFCSLWWGVLVCVVFGVLGGGSLEGVGRVFGGVYLCGGGCFFVGGGWGEFVFRCVGLAFIWVGGGGVGFMGLGGIGGGGVGERGSSCTRSNPCPWGGRKVNAEKIQKSEPRNGNILREH